jgi:hypothetical protein
MVRCKLGQVKKTRSDFEKSHLESFAEMASDMVENRRPQLLF